MLRLEQRMPAQCLESMYIVKQHKLFMMHKDAEEVEALCQSVVRDGGLRQM